MSGAVIRTMFRIAVSLLVGVAIGGGAVFYCNPGSKLKRVKLDPNLPEVTQKFLRDASGMGIGSFVVYHIPGEEETLSVAASMTSYPVVFIRKKGPDKVEIAIADKGQNILGADFVDGVFENTSFANARQKGLTVTSIDMNADGTYDLVGQQTDNSVDLKFFFDGKWYPYKVERGQWMIETEEGWRGIKKAPSGFEFR